MKTYSFFHPFCMGILVLFSVNAFAGEQLTAVPALRLQNITHDSNRAVTVFYASGRGASFTTDGGIPLIRTLKAEPVRAEISPDGSAAIAPIKIPKKGFQILNYLVVVVHPANQQDVRIRNADGSAPSLEGLSKGPVQDSPSFDNDRVIYFRLKLNHSKKSVTEIGSVPVTSTDPVVLNLENP